MPLCIFDIRAMVSRNAALLVGHDGFSHVFEGAAGYGVRATCVRAVQQDQSMPHDGQGNDRRGFASVFIGGGGYSKYGGGERCYPLYKYGH